MHRFVIVTLTFVSAALLCLGCGPKGEGDPVTGKVTFQGQPLPNAALIFFPDVGRPLTAPVDAGGDFSLRLPPGEYKVTVNIGAEIPPGWKEGDPLPTPAVKIPVQYTQRVRTPLNATIVEGHADPLNFEVK